jgi:hypothetical protein
MGIRFVAPPLAVAARAIPYELSRSRITAIGRLLITNIVSRTNRHLANRRYVRHNSVGVPHVRTSVRGPKKMGRSPSIALYPRLKAVEKNHIRPTYPGFPVKANDVE